MQDSFSRFVIASPPIGGVGGAAAPHRPHAPDSAFEMVPFHAPALACVDDPCTITLPCGDREEIKVRPGVLFRSGERPPSTRWHRSPPITVK